MAKFFYTTTLDRVEIKESELNQRFADLTLKINTTKFDINSFRKRSIRYRHLMEPPIIYARSKKAGSQIFAGVLTKLGAWNWTGVVVAHGQTQPTAPNGTELLNPVIYLHGMYRSHDWQTGSYEIGIGYSVDNGVTYTLWANSEKFLGYTMAHTDPRWTGKTTHYHTGAAANWWSRTMYGKRECNTVAIVKSQNGVNIPTVTHWAIGIRVNGTLSNGNGTKDVHELDVAKLELIARDST